MRPARKDAAELMSVCAANLLTVCTLLTPFFLDALLQSRAASVLARAVATVAAATLAFAFLHELLHAAAARALGSRAAVRVFSLGFQTLFLDPLPPWKTALVYLAPLLATPIPLALQAAGLPRVYAALWVSLCAGDAAALPWRLSERARAFVCTPDGRVMALR